MILSSRGLVIISPQTTVPVATKPGRMITYLDELPPIKPHDPSIRRFCEVM